jgi:hypothetical protein
VPPGPEATRREGLGLPAQEPRLPDLVAGLSGMVVVGLMIEDADRAFAELRVALMIEFLSIERYRRSPGPAFAGDDERGLLPAPG